MTTPPPLPVITQNGFFYFAHQNGRFSRSVTVGGAQIHARDYRAYVQDALVREPFLEPDDSEFIKAMNWRK